MEGIDTAVSETYSSPIPDPLQDVWSPSWSDDPASADALQEDWGMDFVKSYITLVDKSAPTSLANAFDASKDPDPEKKNGFLSQITSAVTGALGWEKATKDNPNPNEFQKLALTMFAGGIAGMAKNKIDKQKLEIEKQNADTLRMAQDIKNTQAKNQEGIAGIKFGTGMISQPTYQPVAPLNNARLNGV